MNRKMIMVVCLCLIFMMSCLSYGMQDKDDRIILGAKVGSTFFSSSDMTQFMGKGIEDNPAIAAEVKIRVFENLLIGIDCQRRWGKKSGTYGVNKKFNIDTATTSYHCNVYAVQALGLPMGYEGDLLYLGGGLSFLSTRITGSIPQKDVVVSEGNGAGANKGVNFNETLFGYNLTAGYQFDQLFVELQYVEARTGPYNFLQDIDGKEHLSMGGFNIWAGIRFNFSSLFE